MIGSVFYVSGAFFMPCHRAVHYVRGNGQAGLQGARPPVDRNRRLLLREEEKEEKRNSVEKINFFQRVVPLQSMIKRAIKHGDAIMWGRP